MKMYLKIICLLGLSLNAFAQHGHYETKRKTVMELAIQHFNKNHSKKIDTQSKEFRFMETLFNKLEKKMPGYSGYTIRELITKSYTSLEFEKYQTDKVADPVITKFLNEINLLTTGCPVNEEKTISTADYSLVNGPRVRTTTIREFRLNERTPYNTDRKVCKDVLVKILNSYSLH